MPNEATEDLTDRDWMTATNAGTELGIHRNTVLLRAAKGAFRVKTVDGMPFVHRDDVAAAKAEQDAAKAAESSAA